MFVLLSFSNMGYQKGEDFGVQGRRTVGFEQLSLHSAILFAASVQQEETKKKKLISIKSNLAKMYFNLVQPSV